MTTVKFRTHEPRLQPRRTRLEIPGWSGTPDKRLNGSREQPWHCVPFSEAATAGIELCYPYEHELRVTRSQSGLVLEYSGSEGVEPPPFRDFGTQYYTYQSVLDFKVDGEWAIKTEPHPRFYTDTSGTVPIAVPAQIRHWWPMIYFLVFKSPEIGKTHIFRPGEPFVQITVVPANPTLDLVVMNEAEAAEREMQSRRIYASRQTLSAQTQWTSSTHTVFDGTYRRMAIAARAIKE